MQRHINEQEEKSRYPSIKEFLLEETKDTLQEMAEDLHLTRYKSLDKNSLAEKIRDEILKPEVMAKRMLLLSDVCVRAGGYCLPDDEKVSRP